MLAWHIYYSTYGTWLHGDERGAHSPEGFVPPDKHLELSRKHTMASDAFVLTKPMRSVVERAIRGVCDYRGWKLFAVNVRTNHVHTVVSSNREPKHILRDFKVYASRELSKAGLIENGTDVWTRGGGKKQILNEGALKAVIEYVRFRQ